MKASKFNATLRNLVQQLQTHFLVKAINPFRVDQPAFALKQDVDAPINRPTTASSKASTASSALNA
jgi:hypothetical protein